MGKGSPQGQPANTTQTTTSEYPTELKPFIKDIFGKAKGIEEQRTSQGYQPYTGPRIAEFTQDQQDAFTGIRDAQGASTPYFTEQETLIDRATRETTPELTQQYMNPYTQTVINQQLRELGRQGEQERQRIGAGAVGAGGYGGSRQAILEAEQMRNEGMRGDDIQARGLNQAFNVAQQAIQQQRAADAAGANMFGQMAQNVPAQRMKELGALSGIGSALQQQQQRGLDLGFQQFTDEYNFPMKNLNEYSAILRGFPLSPTQNISRAAYSPTAPLSSQLLGAGVGLGSAAMMGGMFGASGGQVKKLQQGGLASLYSQPSNRVRMGKTNYQNVSNASGFANSPLMQNLNNFNNWTQDNIGRALDGSIDWLSATAWNALGAPYDLASKVINTGADLLGQENPELSWGKTVQNILGPNRVEDLVIDNSLIDLPGSTVADTIRYEEEKKREANRPKTDNPNVITPEGDREIEEATMKLDIGVEKRNKMISDLEAVKKMAEDTATEKANAADERIRYKTWLPVLASASKIMSAPNFGAAVGEIFNAGARGVAGRMKGKADEVKLRSGLRKNALENAKVLSEISKNLSPDAAVAGYATALKALLDQGVTMDNPTVQNLAAGLSRFAASSSDRNITDMISQTIKVTPAGVILSDDVDFNEVINQLSGYKTPEYLMNEGGTVTLAKGSGDPKIRTFDFVEEDGILKAVQTESN